MATANIVGAIGDTISGVGKAAQYAIDARERSEEAAALDMFDRWKVNADASDAEFMAKNVGGNAARNLPNHLEAQKANNGEDLIADASEGVKAKFRFRRDNYLVHSQSKTETYTLGQERDFQVKTFSKDYQNATEQAAYSLAGDNTNEATAAMYAADHSLSQLSKITGQDRPDIGSVKADVYLAAAKLKFQYDKTKGLEFVKANQKNLGVNAASANAMVVGVEAELWGEKTAARVAWASSNPSGVIDPVRLADNARAELESAPTDYAKEQLHKSLQAQLAANNRYRDASAVQAIAALGTAQMTLDTAGVAALEADPNHQRMVSAMKPEDRLSYLKLRNSGGTSDTSAVAAFSAALNDSGLSQDDIRDQLDSLQKAPLNKADRLRYEEAFRKRLADFGNDEDKAKNKVISDLIETGFYKVPNATQDKPLKPGSREFRERTAAMDIAAQVVAHNRQNKRSLDNITDLRQSYAEVVGQMKKVAPGFFGGGVSVGKLAELPTLDSVTEAEKVKLPAGVTDLTKRAVLEAMRRPNSVQSIEARERLFTGTSDTPAWMDYSGPTMDYYDR
jgi:hypothetical protein